MPLSGHASVGQCKLAISNAVLGGMSIKPSSQERGENVKLQSGVSVHMHGSYKTPSHMTRHSSVT